MGLHRPGWKVVWDADEHTRSKTANLNRGRPTICRDAVSCDMTFTILVAHVQLVDLDSYHFDVMIRGWFAFACAGRLNSPDLFRSIYLDRAEKIRRHRTIECLNEIVT